MIMTNYQNKQKTNTKYFDSHCVRAIDYVQLQLAITPGQKYVQNVFKKQFLYPECMCVCVCMHACAFAAACEKALTKGIA